MFKVLYFVDEYLDVVSFEEYWDAVDFAEQHQPSEVLVSVKTPMGCEHFKGTNGEHQRSLRPEQLGFVCTACRQGYAFTNIKKESEIV